MKFPTDLKKKKKKEEEEEKIILECKKKTVNSNKKETLPPRSAPQPRTGIKPTTSSTTMRPGSRNSVRQNNRHAAHMLMLKSLDTISLDQQIFCKNVSN